MQNEDQPNRGRPSAYSAKIAEAICDRLIDGESLRASSPTMMARMSVSREVAEHCLAHVPPGVEKVYNRYNYLPQKREAFEKLAELVERIVTSLPRGNVVSINRDAAAG